MLLRSVARLFRARPVHSRITRTRWLPFPPTRFAVNKLAAQHYFHILDIDRGLCGAHQLCQIAPPAPASGVALIARQGLLREALLSSSLKGFE